MKNKDSAISRWLIIFSLVFAGEMIFSLPFHIARFFRPTFLTAFNFSNSDFGDIISFYGITAMIAYFPGGIIADRFSARRLMTVSLLATAAGGLFLTLIPGYLGLSILFGYWGITTILVFWSAMIKATREWGGNLEQGKAFGILDGGRGLVAAGVASFGVYLLSNMFPDNIEVLTDAQRISSLQTLIWYYTILTALAGLLVWFVIPENKNKQSSITQQPLKGIKSVIRNRNVWMQAIIVVCAYCGYKSLDYYSLYAVDILGMNELESAQFVSNAAYLRPVAAISAGFIVDRFNAKKVIQITFIVLVLIYTSLFLIVPSSTIINLITVNILISFFGVYALRGVYFALVAETKIPVALTGTAVGLISVIGYTPDIFINSLAGRILDANPGQVGYQNYFLMLAIFSIIGLIATFVLTTNKKLK